MQQQIDKRGALLWDLPTRVFHWALAGSFLGAYLLSEQDGLRNVHVMFGYTVLGLLAFRLLWGFVGSRHSRFSDFTYGLGAAVRYLRELAAGRATDYPGHNPAGSWAIYGLLLLAGATGITGWLNYNGVGGETFEEIHEVLANSWLVLVLVHVVGVIVGSLAHRRNLAVAMITGRRRELVTGGVSGDAEPVVSRSRWTLGATLAAAVLGFWTWALTTGGGSLLAGAEGVRGEHERGPQAQHETQAGGARHGGKNHDDPED